MFFLVLCNKWLGEVMGNEISGKSDFFETMGGVRRNYLHADLPHVSIIIPCTNSAEKLSGTLESVLAQDYPSFEVIVTDCECAPVTNVIREYTNDKVHLYVTTSCQRYNLINKGLSQATGFYVNVLFPGDYYLHKGVLTNLMHTALDNNRPHLIYCGCLIRNGKDIKTLYRPLSLNLLKKGQQPTSLQSCWFRMETLKELGKFNPKYELRGGFELFCRFCLANRYTYIGVNRVLTDYDLRIVTKKMIITHFTETIKTIYIHFGGLTTVKWLLFYQKDIGRLLRLWWKRVKFALAGK